MEIIKIRLWLTLAVLSLSCGLSDVAVAQNDVERLSNRAVYEESIDTVAWVSVDTGGGRSSEGTAFLLSRALPYVITNEHVIQGRQANADGSVDVYFPVRGKRGLVSDRDFYRNFQGVLGELGFYAAGNVVWADRERDLALIELIDWVPRGGSDIDFERCEEGENVHILGNPDGGLRNAQGEFQSWGLWRWSNGRISSCEDDITIETSAFRGASGGPVLDSRGRIVGVMTTSDLGFSATAIPIGEVARALVELRQWRRGEGQDPLGIVSFENRTGFSISYVFRCNGNAQRFDLENAFRRSHYCAVDRSRAGSPSLTISYDYLINGDTVDLREHELEASMRFGVQRDVLSRVFNQNLDSHRYYFYFDGRSEIYLVGQE